MKTRLGIWASGGVRRGGSGFVNLIKHLKPTAPGAEPVLRADIVVVVSQHEDGNIYRLAQEFGIHFEHLHLPEPWTAHQEIFDRFNLDFVALSGFSKHITGHDPRFWFNIHPAILAHTRGLYGLAPHERMIELYRAGEITHTEVTMHFVTAEYDSLDGVFFKYPVRILDDDTPDSLQKRVGQAEHYWQPIITQRVLDGFISWDGKNPMSVQGAKFFEKS